MDLRCYEACHEYHYIAIYIAMLFPILIVPSLRYLRWRGEELRLEDVIVCEFMVLAHQL